ncbi:MAG: hypothetical protein Q7K11_00930 [Candidatus Berkelbacteria bacterium]|nr:hypothetical protein [Candidatus Berkelbacteria bacterium]
MAYFFIIAAVLIRVLSHFGYLVNIPNFAPIAAMALFGGVYLGKKYALIIPLVAMIISDIFIGFYSPWVMISVYGSFFLIGLIGIWLKNHKTAPNVIGSAIFGSIIFFLITNFAVWAIPHSIYPQTLQGLMQSYIMGLPFFKGTLLGDLFYTSTLFILMETAIYITHKYPIKKEWDVKNLKRVRR